jgi:D-alanine-D-alanine ligase
MQQHSHIKTVAVVCGGYSGEAVVSKRSAQMVMDHIDRSRFEPIKVQIDRTMWKAEYEGAWYPMDRNDFTFLVKGTKHRFDGVFMIIHGTPGEDGILQGYFEMLGIPVTTGGVFTQALTFNKKATTRVLASMGFHTARSLQLKALEPYSASFVLQHVGLPCFVKPNCGGSSLGTSRVNQTEELHLAIDKAFAVDEQVIIEEFVAGTEVTCGVIVWQGKVMALPVTEIVTKKEFFDFEAKYQGLSEEITPARLSPEVTQLVQQLSEDIFKKLECRGMIRVDYIIRENEPFVIEVNTTPGFSEASIIPQQAAAVGISKSELISAVIDGCF